MITQHSIQRGEERLGLSLEPFKKLVDKALNKGIKHSQAKGSLRKYFDKLYLYNGTANNIRIYGEFVYLFRGKTLITVLNLPNEYKGLVNRLRKELKEKV